MTLQLLFHNLATASDEGIVADCLAERKAEQQFVLNQVMGATGLEGDCCFLGWKCDGEI